MNITIMLISLTDLLIDILKHQYLKQVLSSGCGFIIKNIELLFSCKRSLDKKNLNVSSTHFKTSYIHNWTTVMQAMSFRMRDDEGEPRETARTYSSISDDNIGWKV